MRVGEKERKKGTGVLIMLLWLALVFRFLCSGTFVKGSFTYITCALAICSCAFIYMLLSSDDAQAKPCRAIKVGHRIGIRTVKYPGDFMLEVSGQSLPDNNIDLLIIINFIELNKKLNKEFIMSAFKL